MQLKTLFRSPPSEADLASAQDASYASSPTSHSTTTPGRERSARMTKPDTYSERLHPRAQMRCNNSPTRLGSRPPVTLTPRRQADLVSARNRRVLAQWPRRTASYAVDPDPIRRRRDVLLHYLAAAPRTDLLQIAATLEHAHDRDPARIAALHNVPSNACDSPLYNAGIHTSEPKATLVRAGL
jgi:hypothetical protein